MQDSLQPGSREFATTRWSMVCGARGGGTGATDDLAKLCKAYWYPLYAYVRRQGHSAHDAQDLTQEFFARLIEKGWLEGVEPERGRFRSWLLASLQHFLTNEWRNSRRQKRGGGAEMTPLDAVSAEARYANEPVDIASAERLYDRRWALDLLDMVLARLEDEWTKAGKAEQFAAMRFCLTGDKIPLATVALRLGISEGAVKVAVHRLRERYRELIRAEVADTVSSPSQADAEIAELLAALRR